MRNERRTQIEALCASNANALARVRDEAENSMAVVNAVRQAETMRARIAEEDGPTGMARPTAGLVIVIGNQSSGGTVIEHRPAGPPLIIEAGAHERGPPDDDLVDNDGDEALVELPPPVRAVKPARPARDRPSYRGVARAVTPSRIDGSSLFDRLSKNGMYGGCNV